MIIDLVRNGRRKVLTWLDKIDFRANQILWEEAIRRIVILDGNAFFMEIGAWDGIGADCFYPLVKKYKISGILIEPQEDAFRKLKENYAYHNKIFFDNIAVAEKDCIKPLYFISLNSQTTTPAYASLKKEVTEKGVAFLQRNNILPVGEFSQYILSKPVQCLSISTIIKKHKLNKIDILQIDTEGYEYEILKSMPFDKIKPKIIRCEYKHMDRAGYRNSIKILKRNGYSVILHVPDILALNNIKGIKKRLFLNYLIQLTRKITYEFEPWPHRQNLL
jgi:FkbM family methyltransferase